MIKEFKFKKCNWNDAPLIGGVYIVIYKKSGIPIFKNPGSGPKIWHERVVNVPEDKLINKWVDFKNGEDRIIYIGKADGSGYTSTLSYRINLYKLFGSGRNVSHYGGRYIWQIANKNDLEVYYKEVKNPRSEENKLLLSFRKEHDQKLPFANLKV